MIRSTTEGDPRELRSPTSHISALSISHCEQLLSEEDIGRIAGRAQRSPAAPGVLRLARGRAIVLRPSPHGMLAELADPHDEVFEVDLLDAVRDLSIGVTPQQITGRTVVRQT